MKSKTVITTRALTAIALSALLGACSTAYAQQHAKPGERAAASSDGQQGGGVKVSDVTEKAGDLAVTPQEQAVREQVTFLLSGYEYFPTREELDQVALAPVITPVLMAMTREEGSAPSLRNRAVDALGFYGGEEQVVAHLRALALEETAGLKGGALRAARTRRYHAITSFARAGGADATEALQGLMDHEEVQVQLSAISALGKFGGEKGRGVLEARLKVEPDQAVKRELRKHISP